MSTSGNDRNKAIENAKVASDASKISESVNQISNLLSTFPDDIELLHNRAMLFEKKQEWAKAINDYLKILSLDKSDKKARTQTEMLKTILRYNNIDIYSSPNTHYDPWFE